MTQILWLDYLKLFLDYIATYSFPATEFIINKLCLYIITKQDTELETLFEEKSKVKDHYMFQMLIKKSNFQI